MAVENHICIENSREEMNEEKCKYFKLFIETDKKLLNVVF